MVISEIIVRNTEVSAFLIFAVSVFSHICMFYTFFVHTLSFIILYARQVKRK